jgi:hypothetical protein
MMTAAVLLDPLYMIIKKIPSQAATGACTAYLLKGPVGIWEGAFFCAVRWVAVVPTTIFNMGCLGNRRSDPLSIKKVIGIVLEILIPSAIAWGSLSLTGLPISLENILFFDIANRALIEAVAYVCKKISESLKE